MAIRNEILRRRIARVTMLAAAEGDALAKPLTPRARLSHDGDPAHRLHHRRLCDRGGGDRGDDRLRPRCDYRALSAALAALEARGAKRKSDAR